MTTISSFRSIGKKEKKHDMYKRKDCMKIFCEFFRERAIRINNLKNKKMQLLTKEQQESKFENAKICYICKGKLNI